MTGKPTKVTDVEAFEAIEALKAAGLVEVLPEDIEKPWAEQRLRKTPLGERHHAMLEAKAVAENN